MASIQGRSFRRAPGLVPGLSAQTMCLMLDHLLIFWAPGTQGRPGQRVPRHPQQTSCSVYWERALEAHGLDPPDFTPCASPLCWLCSVLFCSSKTLTVQLQAGSHEPSQQIREAHDAHTGQKCQQEATSANTLPHVPGTDLSILCKFPLFTYITCEVGAMAVLISELRTQRPREVKELGQCHTAHKWQS